MPNHDLYRCAECEEVLEGSGEAFDHIENYHIDYSKYLDEVEPEDVEEKELKTAVSDGGQECWSCHRPGDDTATIDGEEYPACEHHSGHVR